MGSEMTTTSFAMVATATTVRLLKICSRTKNGLVLLLRLLGGNVYRSSNVKELIIVMDS